MEKIQEYPAWRINLEIEPETFDSVKIWEPDIYEAFRGFIASQDGKTVEITNPTYAQPYCYNISGESLIRQFTYGMKKLHTHFPTVKFHTYAVEEPCFTSSLPQLLRLFGFKYAVLKNPDTCYGGYTAANGGETVWWTGPDGTSLLTVPRYETEELEENSTWQTIAWNNQEKYRKTAFDAGIMNPIGMCYQDAGWKNGPWIGNPEQISSKYTLWTSYLDTVANRQNVPQWHLSQEDIQVSLMWGSHILQQLAQQIRKTENKLVQTEKIAALRKYFDESPYPQNILDQAWRGLLLSQHHDCWIVPYNQMGSTGRTWAENVCLYTTQSDSICDIILAPHTREKTYLTIYNTTLKERKELITDTIPLYLHGENLQINDRHGKVVPHQLLPDGKFCFQATVPPLGTVSYSLETGKKRKKKEISGYTTLPDGCVRIENNRYRIDIDREHGGIIRSLYNKIENKEWVDRNSSYGFNELRGHFYEEGGFISSSSTPATVSIETDGIWMKRLKIEGFIGKYPFTQYITLVEENARIDMETSIHWSGNPRIGEYKEESKWQEVRKGFYDDRYKLHLLFPINQARQTIYKNAPFDVCKSDLTHTFFNRWDSIKNNVILHWVDCYGETENRGMTLFTDHTTSYLYGEDYPLGLTVQYAGNGLWSRDYTVEEETHIKYSLLPHTGVWHEADISSENEYRNEPLLVVYTDRPLARSLLSCRDKGLIIPAMYYEGEDMVLRIYNEEKEGDKIIDFNSAPVTVSEIDLYNNLLPNIPDLSGKQLIVPMKAFEIKTYRITW